MPTASIMFPATRAYYEWLGRFVEAFAGIEALLFSALVSRAGVTPDVGSAVFSGTRATTAMSFINRICEIDGTSQAVIDELKDVFKQFNAINDIRNSILHHGTVSKNMFKISDQRTSTNRTRSLPTRRSEDFRVTTDILKDLTDDCVKISQHLFYMEVFSDDPPEERIKYLPILTAAWRYKPDAPPPRR